MHEKSSFLWVVTNANSNDQIWPLWCDPNEKKNKYILILYYSDMNFKTILMPKVIWAKILSLKSYSFLTFLTKVRIRHPLKNITFEWALWWFWSTTQFHIPMQSSTVWDWKMHVQRKSNLIKEMNESSNNKKNLYWVMFKKIDTKATVYFFPVKTWCVLEARMFPSPLPSLKTSSLHSKAANSKRNAVWVRVWPRKNIPMEKQ